MFLICRSYISNLSFVLHVRPVEPSYCTPQLDPPYKAHTVTLSIFRTHQLVTFLPEPTPSHLLLVLRAVTRLYGYSGLYLFVLVIQN